METSTAQVRDHLGELRCMGFDAIQISPAQKSKEGHEWWKRLRAEQASDNIDCILKLDTIVASKQCCFCGDC
eukprot:575359-Amphidinium_carterae.1